ncbi:uncharacterized protein LOC101737592 isoform X2 [Bombyx mori]|uniref:Rad21/Rec8-like protein N-terminal domain-containing protein n=1 Tax=Bombyx mori TaxID=7091 RepID=A0A8R2HRD8_BOMMO|nr:uncharacterized protein LOC101737592 isoform X2 [Bombyx mori]
MFYPVDSLKRGGRFYLCWVADSWPLRFATITHRQLWSQDIRRICDDLIEVMNNESGRPSNRFSLRLSSQLMRGLVRLYQRKVTVFLSDLCMINAHVIKNTNKKWNVHDASDDEERPHRARPRQLPQLLQFVLREDPNEQRIEELIQSSGNVVTNVQDITLKEATIPVLQLPQNDNFGDENQDVALQLLTDRTLEMMLQADGSAAQHSGLDLPLDSTDKSHDKSRLPVDPQMERISELNVSMFGREIPEIPVFPIPDLNIPQTENKNLTEDAVPELAATEPKQILEISNEQRVIDEIELEELEELEPQTKRRRIKNKLIVDKKIKLGGNLLRARIENPAVELRCEDSSDDIIEIRTPWDILFRTPSHVGGKPRSNFSLKLTRLYVRNLGPVAGRPYAEREMEEAMQRSRRSRVRSVLERIEEVEEPQQGAPPHTEPLHIEHVTETEINFTKDMNNTEIAIEQNLDISMLPTQKIEVQARKRVLECEAVESPKRQRSIGYVSFRQSQQLRTEITMALPDPQAEKENVPDFGRQATPSSSKQARRKTILTENISIYNEQPKDSERSVTAMLHEVGLADAQEHPAELHAATAQRPPRPASGSSETPLGSLDRTKVSLGDSEQTTDSKRFIRDQWGTEGTMIKILKHIKAGLLPINVTSLVLKGPLVPGYKKIIAARCFASLLKLKQHGFIKIIKDVNTLEVCDIMLGSKFE